MQGTLRVSLDAGPAVHQRAGLAPYTQRIATALLTDHRDAVSLTSSTTGIAPATASCTGLHPNAQHQSWAICLATECFRQPTGTSPLPALGAPQHRVRPLSRHRTLVAQVEPALRPDRPRSDLRALSPTPHIDQPAFSAAWDASLCACRHPNYCRQPPHGARPHAALWRAPVQDQRRLRGG